MAGMGRKQPLGDRSSLVLRRPCIGDLSGKPKANAKVMSRFTSTLADRVYMAVETVLDQYRRDGLSEVQIRAVLDRAINASRQLEATAGANQATPRLTHDVQYGWKQTQPTLR